MNATPPEDLETFLRRQDPTTLAAVLLELAERHEPVRRRLERLQLSGRPDRLAAEFRKSLTAWKRSTRFHAYSDTGDFARMLAAWLDQVARELLPAHPAIALGLFEAFVEADTRWFERTDDSDGLVGDAVREACRLWLQAASRSPVPAAGWPARLLALVDADEYGACDELLRRAHLLLDEAAQRALVARLESQLRQTVAAGSPGSGLSPDVFRIAGSLSLLSESLRDPDIEVRATLCHSPDPTPQQRHAFARAFLEADRPADALVWLQASWAHLDGAREPLLAQALERLGRFEDSLPIRRRVFERTLSACDLECWLAHLPEAARPDAKAHARARAGAHDDPVIAATLLLHLDDAEAAEDRLVADSGRIDGGRYPELVPLAAALSRRACARGATAVLRALLHRILERGYVRAYDHAAHYWTELGRIARAGASLHPLPPHEAFEAEVRRRHGRKTAFWRRADPGAAGR